MRDSGSATTSSRSRRPWLRGGLIVLGLFLFTFWPLLSVLLASAVAGARGCALDEGSVHPCLIAGRDVGTTLYALFVLGWFALVTLPLGLLLSGVVAVWAILRLLARRKKNASAQGR